MLPSVAKMAFGLSGPSGLVVRLHALVVLSTVADLTHAQPRLMSSNSHVVKWVLGWNGLNTLHVHRLAPVAHKCALDFTLVVMLPFWLQLLLQSRRPKLQLVVVLATGDHGQSGQDVISRVEVDRLLVCDIINVRARLRKKLNSVMIPVVQLGMIGLCGLHARLPVAKENKCELVPMYVPKFPIINKRALVSPFYPMILITCGPSGRHVLHHAKEVVEFAQLLMFVALQAAWMLNHVVNPDSGWTGLNGQVVQSLVVLVQ